jgi:hypothetical protein
MQSHKSAAIEVPGKPTEVDSFAVCLQAALKRWGREVPYDCVAGLAGTAFSPPFDRSARCPALWMDAGADIRVEFLAHAIGFTVERGTGASLRSEGLTDRFARRTKAALAGGGVLLCRMPRGWNLAGRAATNGDYELVGPAGPGRADEVASDARVYLLQPTERSLTSCEALQAAVEFGALVASGTCPASEVAFGGQIYDAWLERLRQDTFCPECGDNQWRCAERTAGRARRSHVAATRFLNRAYGFLSAQRNAEGLRNAADAFAAMAAALAPFADGAAPETWQDPAQRARYTRGVARVRDLHQEAAGHLCAAAGAI